MSKNSTPASYDQSDCSLCPGELVSESGMYEVCHYDEPRTSALFTRSSVFPYCKNCGENVRFKLVMAAPHISEDPDFSEPVSPVDNSLLNKSTPTDLFPVQLGVAHGFRFLQDTVQAWRIGSEGGDL
jgi:hypothetical protein